MRKILPLILLACIGVYPARATYVNSGKSDFAGAANTQCVPNSGGVTSGNTIYVGVQANSATSVTISSARVPTWVLDRHAGSTINQFLWHGVATSSGADTVTVAFSSGTALIGSACGEYTVAPNLSSLNAPGSSFGTIPASTGSNVIAFGCSSFALTGLNAPFTQRQVIQNTGVTFCAFGDQNAASTATYTATFTDGGSGTQVFMDSLCTGCAGTRHFAQVIKYRNKNPYAPYRPDPVIFIRLPFRRERGKLAAT